VYQCHRVLAAKGACAEACEGSLVADLSTVQQHLQAYFKMYCRDGQPCRPISLILRRGSVPLKYNFDDAAAVAQAAFTRKLPVLMRAAVCAAVRVVLHCRCVITWSFVTPTCRALTWPLEHNSVHIFANTVRCYYPTTSFTAGTAPNRTCTYRQKSCLPTVLENTRPRLKARIIAQYTCFSSLRRVFYGSRWWQALGGTFPPPVRALHISGKRP
jgi:hypothetical protein